MHRMSRLTLFLAAAALAAAPLSLPAQTGTAPPRPVDECGKPAAARPRRSTPPAGATSAAPARPPRLLGTPVGETAAGGGAASGTSGSAAAGSYTSTAAGGSDAHGGTGAAATGSDAHGGTGAAAAGSHASTTAGGSDVHAGTGATAAGSHSSTMTGGSDVQGGTGATAAGSHTSTAAGGSDVHGGTATTAAGSHASTAAGGSDVQGGTVTAGTGSHASTTAGGSDMQGSTAAGTEGQQGAASSTSVTGTRTQASSTSVETAASSVSVETAASGTSVETASSSTSAGSQFLGVETESRDGPIDPRAARRNRDALRLGLGRLGDRKRLGPAASVSVPTAFGVDGGEMFFGLAYQGRTRYTDQDDAAAVVGLGIGTRRVIALEAAVTTYSTFRSYPLETGGLSVKLHRALPRQTSVAVGWENAVLWGGSDDDGSLYGVVTKMVTLRQDPEAPLNTAVLTVGVGNGRFRFENDDADGNETVNLFAAAGARITPQVSLVADWTGQDLNAAASLTPLPRVPVVITVGLADLTGSAGDGARFILSLGYGLAFRAPSF
jgi:hypothetical protein